MVKNTRFKKTTYSSIAYERSLLKLKVYAIAGVCGILYPYDFYDIIFLLSIEEVSKLVKKVTNNTLLFLFIIAFVKGFSVLFGSNNSLVGVTLVIALLVLMTKDLTEKPIENLLKLTLLNIILGIFSYISSGNIWVGLALNFFTLCVMGYLLSYDLNKMIIVPFGLEYLFMLYTPVTGDAFIKRIISLIAGSILIMAVQLVVHRKNKNMKKVKVINNDEEYRVFRILGKNYRIHKRRGCYAMKIGLLTSITAFVVSFFNLNHGRWMVYTIFSLTELYSDQCKIRAKERLQGTIIGTIITLGLFMLIKDTTIRGVIVLIGGYLDTYTTNYRDKIICVTISVVASVSLVNGMLITAFERITYVFLGIILSLLVNKFILETKSHRLVSFE